VLAFVRQVHRIALPPNLRNLSRMRSHQKETAPIRSRPQYHYFYGSTNASAGDVSESSVAGTDADTILLGECLVQTDNEEETPNSSAQDLRHLVVTTKNGHSRIKHAYQLEMPIPEAQNGRRSPHSPRRKSIWLLCAEQCLNLGGVHPVGHVTRIIVILVSAISMGTCILVLLPNSPTTSTGAANARSSCIPFQIVDRANFNDPAAKIVNLDLFDPSLRFQGGQKLGKRTFQSSSTGVDPVLRVEPDGHGISFPIVSYPYAFKWSDSLLQASYPACRRNVDSTSTRHVFQPDIVFGTSEAIAKRHVMKFDPLSVTLRYFANTDGFWETYIVHGAPYITIKYSAVTPVFTTRSRFLKVMCPFDSDGNYNDGEARIFSKYEGRQLKWGVCTDSSSVCNRLFSMHIELLVNGSQLVTHLKNYFAYSSQR
jgi:Glycosyl hydrolase family 81 N-terminal domain